MSITLLINFKVKPEKLEAFTELLAGVQTDLPGKGGCKDIRILRNIDEETAIALVESWASKADHQAHFDEIVASGAWDHVKSHLVAEPSRGYYSEG